MKNRIFNTLISTVIMLFTVGSGVAQTTGQQTNNTQIQAVLTRIESNTRTFKAEIQRNGTGYPVNDKDLHERLNGLVGDFENATANMRSRFDSRQDATGEVSNLLNTAFPINNFVAQSGMPSRVQSQWSGLRSDLNTLARYYRISWNWNQQPGTVYPAYTGTDNQLRNLISKIESKTDVYKKEMDRSLDRSRINNTNSEDSINSYIGKFEDATNNLKERFNDRQSTATDASEVLNRGLYINQFMLKNRMSRPAENQWTSLRTDLNTLASYYRVSWNWNQPISTTSDFPVYTATDNQLRTLISQIESKTDVYKKQMDRSLDRSRINNTNSEDSINSYIGKFEEATNKLKDRFNDRRSTSADASEVLNRGLYIDQFMAKNTMSRPAENQWSSLRTDLNTLAAYYRVSWNWNQPVSPTSGYPAYSGTENQLRTLISQIENKTNTYKRQMDRSLDRSSINNTNTEDSINSYISKFEDATDQLRDRFNSRQSTGADASEVLNRGHYINRFMAGNKMDRAASRQWESLRTDLNTLATYYRVSWDWNQVEPYGGSLDPRITGTYRLNTGRSDNISDVINRSTGSYNTNQRENARQGLERRLMSPEMIAIEKNNETVTIASSNSPQVTFDADGTPKTETNERGRTVTTTAKADRIGITINHEGDRINDFYVMFASGSNGQLEVTRRIYLENRNETITVSSVYDKVNNAAQWATVNNGQNGGGTVSTNDFYVPNGTLIVASLRGPVSTKSSQVGDRFEMDVTSPGQYRGAVIVGQVAKAADSGRFSGRANISLEFDTIIINGRSYRFAGIIDGVTAANGDNITVNNEGTVRDSSQTTTTAKRAGIGAVIGAIIGAVVDGAQGAAIGAGVGAGAGAGSVLITGRDSLELGPGSAFNITATAPANVGVNR